VAPLLAVVAAFQLVAGAGNGTEIVAGDTIYQRHVPRHLRARVYGLSSTAIAIGSGLAMALGGLLIEVSSPRTAFIVAGIGGLVVAAIAAPALLRAHES
jgi:MFS family permease